MIDVLEKVYRFILREYEDPKSQALEGEVVSREARDIWHTVCEALGKCYEASDSGRIADGWVVRTRVQSLDANKKPREGSSPWYYYPCSRGTTPYIYSSKGRAENAHRNRKSGKFETKHVVQRLVHDPSKMPPKELAEMSPAEYNYLMQEYKGSCVVEYEFRENEVVPVSLVPRELP